MLFILLCLIIIWVVVNRARNRTSSADTINQTPIKLPKEEIVSEVFLLLSVIFLGQVLSGFNTYCLNNLLAGSLLSFAMVIISFIVAYYFKTIVVLIYSLVSLMIWWVAQSLIWLNSFDIKLSICYAGIILIALILYILSRLHDKNDKFKFFSNVYEVTGLMIIFALLFFCSTTTGLSFLENSMRGNAIFASWQLVLSILIMFIALLLALSYTFKQKQLFPIEVAMTFIIMGLAVALILAPAQKLFLGDQLSNVGIVWAVIINIAVCLIILGLIFVGYHRNDLNLVNIGILLLFILAIIKYFDWFLASLNPSLFFIGAGIVFFTMGWLMERGRKKIVFRMKFKHDNIISR